MEQDVIVMLACKLRAHPDLHYDLRRREHGFGAWMRTILEHCCRDAVRKELGYLEKRDFIAGSTTRIRIYRA